MSKRQFEGLDGLQPGLQGAYQGGGNFRYIGKGIYEVFMHPTTYIAQTGSAVTYDLEVGFNHRLIKFQWKHTDNVNADNAAAAAIILYSKCPVTSLLSTLYSEAASTSSTTIVPFGEGYEYLARTYRISTNTTNTHRVYPVLWVQEMR